MNNHKSVIFRVLILIMFLSFGVISGAFGQALLIDFGNDDSWRGVSVEGADGNGNYWNSVWSGAFYSDMKDNAGNITSIDLGFISVGGTDSYNGPAGVCSDPPTAGEIAGTDIDRASLGRLAANEAALDYYISSSFRLQGIDARYKYDLTFFGSHKYSADDTTVYSLCTDSTINTVIDSVSLDVQEKGSPGAHNRNRVAKLTNVSPQSNGSMYIKFAGANGHEGYLNCMMITLAGDVPVGEPSPADNASGVSLDAKLRWVVPGGYVPERYVLSFRRHNDNWQDSGDTMVVDPVVDLGLDGDSGTIEAAMPMELENGIEYYWKVAAYKAGAAEGIESDSWSFVTESGEPESKKMIAHYMPWYQSRDYSGSWGWHWHMNTFSPPDTVASHYKSLFGAYDSSDPHLLASQVLLMKMAGIDGAIIDWYGIEEFWDYGLIKRATDKFVAQCKKAGLEFCICYEDQTVKHMLNNGHFSSRAEAVAHGKEVVQWLADNYFGDDLYLKHNGRPVLLCFGPQFFSYAEWVEIFGVLDVPPVFVPLKYASAPKSGEFDWPNPDSGTSEVMAKLNEFYSRAGSMDWDYFGGAAFPRFHDIYSQTGGSSYGYIDDQEGETYRMTLEAGLTSDADFVQLITWNDYGEGTIIEPTEEDGYSFLEITQELRKQYLEPEFGEEAASLRLPVRLYDMRRAYRADQAKMEKLDDVEGYLFEGDYEKAKSVMDKMECGLQLAGDFNGDCKGDMQDFEGIASLWLDGPLADNWDGDIDISEPKDEVINVLDLVEFAKDWLGE